MTTATFRVCPTCWHPLDQLTDRYDCPRCGYTETLTGERLAPARHCATCTCVALPADPQTS